MKNNKDIAISYLKFMVEIVFFYFFVIPKIIISIVWFDSFQTTKFITTDKTHWTILHSFCLNNKNAQCSLSLFEVAFELWEFNDFTRHFHIFRVFNRMKNLLKSLDMRGILNITIQLYKFFGFIVKFFRITIFVIVWIKQRFNNGFLFYRKLNVYISQFWQRDFLLKGWNIYTYSVKRSIEWFWKNWNFRKVFQ